MDSKKNVRKKDSFKNRILRKLKKNDKISFLLSVFGTACFLMSRTIAEAMAWGAKDAQAGLYGVIAAVGQIAGGSLLAIGVVIWLFKTAMQDENGMGKFVWMIAGGVGLLAIGTIIKAVTGVSVKPVDLK